MSEEDTALNRAMERERAIWTIWTPVPAPREPRRQEPRDPAVTLQPLSAVDAEHIRLWRNQDLSGLRTPYPLTKHQQRKWYEDVVSGREGLHRYWGVRNITAFYPDPRANLLVGMVGLTYIDWYNRHAELALVTAPERRRQGIGRAAVLAVLREAFDNLGLHQVYGECYHCNPALGFWQRLIADYGWHSTTLPARKRWGGEWHDSTYFAIMGVP